MDPGRLRHRLLLQEPGARTSDGGGGYTQRWRKSVHGWVDAAIEPLEGTERLRAMQTQADATHQVTIRYRPGVSAKQRFLHSDGRVFKIVAPPADLNERHRWLEIMCREET